MDNRLDPSSLGYLGLPGCSRKPFLSLPDAIFHRLGDALVGSDDFVGLRRTTVDLAIC
jgi:hypothetical protein